MKYRVKYCSKHDSVWESNEEFCFKAKKLMRDGEFIESCDDLTEMATGRSGYDS